MLFIAQAAHGTTIAFVVKVVLAIVVIAIDAAVPCHVAVKGGGAPELRIEAQVDQSLFSKGAGRHRAETALFVKGDRLRLPQGGGTLHHAAGFPGALQGVEENRPLVSGGQVPSGRTDTPVITA